MNMELSVRDDGQAVVAPRGELNLADTPGVASHLIATVAACGHQSSDGDPLLAAPQQLVRRILEATGLIDVFSVYPSVDEAARGARQARPRVPAAPQ